MLNGFSLFYYLGLWVQLYRRTSCLSAGNAGMAFFLYQLFLKRQTSKAIRNMTWRRRGRNYFNDYIYLFHFFFPPLFSLFSLHHLERHLQLESSHQLCFNSLINGLKLKATWRSYKRAARLWRRRGKVPNRDSFFSPSTCANGVYIFL